MKKKYCASALMALFVTTTQAFSATFGFEDVTNTYNDTVSWLDWEGASDGSINPMSYGSFEGFDVEGNGYNTSSYTVSTVGKVNAYLTYDSYKTSGAGVSNSKSNVSDYNQDMNSASGGASSGNNYVVFNLPTRNLSGMAEYESDYGISGSYNGVSSIGGKNSSFDKTANLDLLTYTSIILDQTVKMESVDLSITAKQYHLLNGLDDNGNESIDGFMGCSIHTKVDHWLYGESDPFMTLRIYGIVDASEGVLTDNYIDWAFAKYIDGTNDILVSGWETVDISDLGEVDGLTFQLVSNIAGEYGINAPNYFALDNLSFSTVPEPSKIAVFIGTIALVCVLFRKQTKK